MNCLGFRLGELVAVEGVSYFILKESIACPITLPNFLGVSR